MPSEIQAVLFERAYWTTARARAWLKRHKYKALKRVHGTAEYYRYRLHSPTRYIRFATKIIPHHIALIIGYKGS